jgi:S1-C subfamily serine protease
MRIAQVVGILLLAAGVAAAVSYGVVTLQRRDTTQTVARGPLTQPGQADGPQTAASRAVDSVVRVGSEPAAVPSAAPTPTAAGLALRGSGAIVDARGYVLTAETVVAGAPSLSVVLSSGKTVSALVVGTDAAEGLALLKVEAANLKPLQVSGSTPMETGSGIAVMAAPPGFQMAVGAVATAHTTTTIADTAQPGREVVLNDIAALDIAQRDGQLGAPILDGAGRLIGLVVAAGAQAYGVDMADAQPSVQQLIDSGHVSYPSLGFDYRQLTASEAAAQGVAAGLEVLAVAPGGAAAQAGIAVGDIVESANGTNLDPVHPLIRILRGMSVRQSVALSVKTSTTTRQVSVPLALVSL